MSTTTRLGALLCLALLAAACVSTPDETHAEAAALAGPEPPVIEFEVDAYDFWFGPRRMTFMPGAEMEVEFANEGKHPHTFSIPALDFEVEAAPGESASGEFVVPRRAGTMRYFCRYSDRMAGLATIGAPTSPSATGALTPLDPAAERRFERAMLLFSGYGFEFDPADCTDELCYRLQARGY